MLKALMKLTGASVLAQFIAFSVMPLVTRLHTPESLGQYQFFTTLSLVITPFISGSFALAIKSARTNYQAAVYLKLGMQYALLCFIALLCTLPILMLILSKSILDWFSMYLPLLFLFVYLSANFQFAMGFLTNSRRYGSQSTYTLTKSLLSNMLKLVFSVLSKNGLSLVLAVIATEGFQLIRVIRLNYISVLRSLFDIKWRHFKHHLCRARVYPTYVTLAVVLGILMNWFPILITGVLYGPDYAGLLGLAFMVVNTPVYPFIKALENVCFGELSREKNYRAVMTTYIKIMLIGIVASVLGLLILGIYGEKLFYIVFGEQWREAGVYAYICFIPISFSFVLSPVYNTLNHFFSFQKFFFWLRLFALTVSVTITGFLGYQSIDFEYFLTAFALSMTVSHLALFSFSVLLVKKRRDDDLRAAR